MSSDCSGKAGNGQFCQEELTGKKPKAFDPRSLKEVLLNTEVMYGNVLYFLRTLMNANIFSLIIVSFGK